MKKTSLNFALTLLLGLFLSFFLPWWSGMLAALIVGAIVRLRKAAAFVVPFSAIALLWLVNAYWLSSANDFILAEKITVLLQIENNLFLLFLVTGLIGGLSAGFAGLLGNQINQLFFTKTE